MIEVYSANVTRLAIVTVLFCCHVIYKLLFHTVDLVSCKCIMLVAKWNKLEAWSNNDYLWILLNFVALLLFNPIFLFPMVILSNAKLLHVVHSYAYDFKKGEEKSSPVWVWFYFILLCWVFASLWKDLVSAEFHFKGILPAQRCILGFNSSFLLFFGWVVLFFDHTGVQFQLLLLFFM